MVDTLFVVHADEQDPDEISQLYQLRGWEITVADPHAADVLDRMAAANPVAAVFCLDGQCGPDVNAVAERALADHRLSRPLMVFVSGSAEDVAAARIISPYGIFVRPDELPWVLKRLVAKT